MKKLFLVAAVLLIMPSVGADAQDDSEIFSRQQLFSVIRNVDPTVDPFSLPSKFKFPTNARDNSVFGVDFSQHQQANCQCTFDWNAVASSKVHFAYLKATEGSTYVDPSLVSNVPAVQKAGIETGVYHFLRSDSDAVAQAKFFLATIKPLGVLILPPSLDLEWDAGPMRDDCPMDAVIKIRRRADEVIIRCDRWGFVLSDSIISRLNAWFDLVKEQTHREPLLYTSAAWWRARIGKKNRMSEIHARLFWVADYSSQGLATEEPGVPPGASRTLWQFTDGASLPIGNDTAHLDASIFDGSVSDFDKQFHAN